jgi:hypothetical protein
VSTVTKTDPAKLPQWQGRPVPWATKWSGEEIPEPFHPMMDAAGDIVLTYRDGNEDRDHGYLWRREGISRGGEPQFKQLNAYRQRASMRLPRCHVCGVRLPKDSPIRWLVPAGAVETVPTGEVTLMSPPTCHGCVELARELCPHLRAHGSTLLEVRQFGLYGLVGEAFIWAKEPSADGQIELVDRIKDMVVHYGSRYRGVSPKNFVARQQIVELLDWTELEVAS